MGRACKTKQGRRSKNQESPGFSRGECQYVAVHGDYDPFTDAGIAKLVMWLGKKPYAVLAGHMHTHFYKETSVVGVQSGSMCGSGDDYTVERRLRGKPSQAACVVNEEGIVTAYPVRL